MDNQTWYLRTSKLALALAIIRSKPADKSSREYTEHLARMVSGQESRWRSKVEALEAEVLQLRQKLLLSRIFSGSFKSGDPSSQLQAQEPKSSENTPTLLEDSGCFLSSEQQMPSEMPQCFGESQIPTLFSSLPIGSRPCALPEEPPSSHMQFLQHLLGLKNLTESEYLKTDLSHFENASATISDSVFQLLDGLIAFYRAPKLPCSSFWTEAIDTLARLVGDCNLSNHILRKCSKKLEEFEKTLLQVILRNNHINRFQVQRYVSQSLVMLGSCRLLRRSIISLLLSEVNSFADDLGAVDQIEFKQLSFRKSQPIHRLLQRKHGGILSVKKAIDTFLVQANYDVARYENMFSVLWVLEQLLQKENKEDNSSRTGHEDQEIKKFLQKHDETVFKLSDAFPLFTFYLWRLGILLNSVEIGTVGNDSLP